LGNVGFIFQIIFFILSSIGGILFWVLKGLKTKISEEYEKKYLLRNILTSVAIFFIGFWIFNSNKPIKKVDSLTPTEYKFTVKNGVYLLENGDTLLSKPN
jgi:hypothetical protein